MSSMGNGGPGMGQSNNAKKGNVYGVQNGDININSPAAAKRRLGLDTKTILVAVPLNVVFFCYGMSAYTGRNTTGDDWRAGISVFLFLVTAGMLGRWVRRRI